MSRLEMPSILIVSGRRADGGDERAAVLKALLETAADETQIVRPRPALRLLRSRFSCIVSVSAEPEALASCALAQRAGMAWIADLSGRLRESAQRRSHTAALADRAILAADVLICATEEERQRTFKLLGTSAAVIAPTDAASSARLLDGLLSEPAPGRLRILMLGPVNSPHMEHLALAMKERGHAVRVGGAHWGGGLPPSELPGQGVPLSVMTRPRALWFRRALRRGRSDVVHANWMPFAGAAALAGARPLVAMAWGSDVWHPSAFEGVLNRVAARRADLAIADSAALVERLIELGADQAHTDQINWGVDLRRFRPAASAEEKRALRASLGLVPDAPTVISARGFAPLYNPDVVLDAFQRVLTDVPSAQLVLKHQGTGEPDLRGLSGSDRVRVVGRVPYEQMASLFRASDVCVSIPTTDSSPRSVWEAMACGCTCVVSDLAWVRELIEPEHHALVVPIDRAALADALQRMLTHPDLRDRIASAGRELVEESRDAELEMDRLERLYFQVARVRNPGRDQGQLERTAGSVG